MTTRACVLRRMPVWRAIATTRRAALLASAQMHPLRTDLHTLFANPLLRLPDFINPIDMNTYCCCHPASIQAGCDNLCAGGARNDLIRNPPVDHPSSTARRDYHPRGSRLFRRYKTIGYRFCGKSPAHQPP